jgi:hypothetical protein
MLDTETPVLLFSDFDRCDGCSQRAYSLARKPDQPAELLFCIHHMKLSMNNLLDEGWEIINDMTGLFELAGNENIVYA